MSPELLTLVEDLAADAGDLALTVLLAIIAIKAVRVIGNAVIFR